MEDARLRGDGRIVLASSGLLYRRLPSWEQPTSSDHCDAWITLFPRARLNGLLTFPETLPDTWQHRARHFETGRGLVPVISQPRDTRESVIRLLK